MWRGDWLKWGGSWLDASPARTWSPEAGAGLQAFRPLPARWPAVGVAEHTTHGPRPHPSWPLTPRGGMCPKIKHLSCCFGVTINRHLRPFYVPRGPGGWAGQTLSLYRQGCWLTSTSTKYLPSSGQSCHLPALGVTCMDFLPAPVVKSNICSLCRVWKMPEII